LEAFFRTVGKISEFLSLEGWAFDYSVPFNSGAFDCQTLLDGGEFDHFFKKKSNTQGVAQGGGWAPLDLTRT